MEEPQKEEVIQSCQEQNKSGTGRETGQGHGRGAETASTDRAKAPVQATHHISREGREEDPETTDTEAEGEETPSRKTAQGQRQKETRGNSTSKFLEGLRKELEEEKDKEVRGISKMKIKILNLKRHLGKNPVGAHRQIQGEVIERYENYCTEQKGMVQGLERAIELVE